jgi:hypothetical protein
MLSIFLNNTQQEVKQLPYTNPKTQQLNFPYSPSKYLIVAT